MTIIFLLTGILAGVAMGYFIAKNSFSKAEQETAILRERLNLTSSTSASLETQLISEREKLNVSNTQLAQTKAELNNLGELLKNQKTEMETLQKKFQTEFENIANKILDEKSKKFTEQNKTNLDIIINPLKEKIKDFEEKVTKAYSAEAAERNTLRGVIMNLTEMNKKISEEANNLARALKGDKKKQGDWGEVHLEIILEKAGLQKEIHYRKQVVLKDEEGEDKKPDFIIDLPENKNIVIDSKVSLNAYTEYFNCESENEKNIFLKKHVDNIAKHIEGLSAKSYHKLYGINTPDFVLMYIPIEPAFNIALETNREMYLWALEKKNIVMVTTSTLLATLSTISFIWKQENQKKHAIEIATESGKLYDKFVGFVEDLVLVGKKMNDAKGSYDEAMKKLHNGPGNLVKKTEQLKQLGAKASKSIPQQLLDRINEDE